MQRGAILALFAHPDDESFAVGGTLARYAAEGIPISIITATRGERSTLGESGRFSTEALGRLRTRELKRAAAVLGVKEVRILGYPDGGLSELPAGKLESDIAAAIEEIRPSAVLTFDVGGVTGHPDHIAMAAAATMAFGSAAKAGGAIASPRHARLFYWVLPDSLAASIEAATGTRWVSTPDDAVGVIVDTSAFLEVQRRAIACHRSQSNPLPEALVARLATQRGREFFVLAESTIGMEQLSGNDLFAEPVTSQQQRP